MVLVSSATGIINEIHAASSLVARNQPVVARKKLEALVKRAPFSFDAWRALGCVLAQLESYPEAHHAFERALSIHPEDAQTHFHCGLVCLKRADAMRAHHHLYQAIALHPYFVDAYKELTLFLIDQHDLSGAKSLLKEGLRKLPLHPDLVYLLIRLKTDMGETEKARRICIEAMHRHPQNIGLFSLYEELHRILPYDAFSLQMQQIYSAMSAPSLQRSDLAFSLARVFERAGDNETAFQYYTQFHEDSRTLEPYDEKSTQRFFLRITELASLPLPKMSTAPVEAGTSPIFIIGMPRSATTLVEQMLDCHPSIHGAGELLVMGNMVLSHVCSGVVDTFPDVIASLDREIPEKFRQLAELYLHEIARLGNGATYVCDKMPNNFLYLSLILRMFPKARIIHCRRNPLDTCVSIYTHHFGGHHPYAHGLKPLGRYYRLYDAFMKHWERQYPESLFTLHYESLIHNTEHTLRALLQYLELPWDARCMEFHTNTRIVRTVSQQQVRSPLFSSGQERTRCYTPYIAPLKEALGDLAD